MEHTFSSTYVRNNHETVAVAATRGRVVIEADNGLAWVAITLVADGYTMSGICTRPDAQAARAAWAIEISDLPGENTVATITGSGGTFDLEGVVAEVERQANTPWLMTAAVYFSHGSERRVLAVCPPDPLPPPFPGGGYHWQSGSGRTIIEISRWHYTSLLTKKTPAPRLGPRTRHGEHRDKNPTLDRRFPRNPSGIRPSDGGDRRQPD